MGQHLQKGIDHTGDMRTIGIVANAYEGDLTTDSDPEFFVPITVHPPQSAYLTVRTGQDPLASVPAVRQAVLTVDSNQPVSEAER